MPRKVKSNVEGRRLRTVEKLRKQTERLKDEIEDGHNLSDSSGGKLGQSSSHDESDSQSFYVHSHYLGEMNLICDYCGAYHFEIEKVGKGTGFTSCCHKGKVTLQPIQPSQFLFKLLTSSAAEAKEYRKNIRKYNSAHAMVSTYAKVEDEHSNGPPFFKIHDQIYHGIGSLIPEDGSTPIYNQVYIYDVDRAAEERMKIPANQDCDKNLMHEISQYISAVNPFAKQLKNMFELIESQRSRRGKKLFMYIVEDKNSDLRRFNNPVSVNEVAIVFKSEDGAPPSERGFFIYPRNNNIQSVSMLHPALDPLAYPLLFPFGDMGWSPKMQHNSEQSTNSRKSITLLQYVAFRLAIRKEFSMFHLSGKLFLQYCVDVYTRIEGSRLEFIRCNQAQLRRDLYVNVMDYVHKKATENHQRVGKIHILPSSFKGSPRQMLQSYQDAMAIVRKYGKPDFFITFTCNPNWTEIQENLFEGQMAWERPDLVVRVFHGKLKSLISEIKNDAIFGKCAALIYTIEFQKRGLPHAHILVSLEEGDKIRTMDQVDDFVYAEIPDKDSEPDLYEIVKTHMLHGPCGNLGRNCPCMKEGKCSKDFPKQFCESTRDTGKGYPLYRRKNNGVTVTKGNVELNNAWVVPYNKYLLLRYNAHINVEVCATVQGVKYIYKYAYKGYDACTVIVSKSENEFNYDEIQSYLTGRYVSSQEAVWRIFEYELHYQSHTVIKLECHLENEQLVYFEETNPDKVLEKNNNTKLTAWFLLNEKDVRARSLTYTQIPNNYKWDAQNKIWQRRKKINNKIVTRLYTVNPKNIELFHLRLLLLHKTGAKSFRDLRTNIVNGRKKTFKSFREAAVFAGLAVNDEHWKLTILEASETQFPKQIRELFAYILGTSVPSNCLDLWNEFRVLMIEDFLQHMSESESTNLALAEINDILVSHSTTCKQLGLPEPKQNSSVDVKRKPDMTKSSYDWLEEYKKATPEQKQIVDLVTNSVYQNKGKLFYLDAPAGYGKTFIQQIIIHKLRSEKRIVLPTAFTGIAASLLEGGRTLHNRFELPVPLLENSVSRVELSSVSGQYIKAASLIIIDEASMVPSVALDVVDKLLKDLQKNSPQENLPFGGKTILLCGDFRQTLPVVPHGGRSITIESCLKSNRHWSKVDYLYLTKNMRVNQGEKDFANFLLEVGNGTLPMFKHDIAILPAQINGNGTEKDAIRFIYPNILDDISSGAIAEKAILAPTNEDCAVINEKVLQLIPGDERVYSSVDCVTSDDINEQLKFPTEFLNSVEGSGLPRHQLRLKVGAIVLLMRNLDTPKGIINGTRLRVEKMYERFVRCTVLTGISSGTEILIPMLKIQPSQMLIPIQFERLQFPLCLAFCMTINKAQGQSLKNIALYLPIPVFTHGQLYVALSRCRSFNGVKVYFKPSEEQKILNDGSFTTRNVVYKEVLRKNT